MAAVVLKSIFEEEILNDYNQHKNADDEFQSNIEFLDYFDCELKENNFNKYIK